MKARSSVTSHPILVLSVCLLLLVPVGWVDYVTGTEFSASILYLFPVVLASWWGPRGSGYLVAALAAVVWYVSAVLPPGLRSDMPMLYADTAMKLLVFVFTAALAETVRRGREALERRVAERTAGLSAEIAERERVEEKLREALGSLGELALQLTRAEQQERDRLAVVLHDDLQHLLVAAKFSLLTLDKEAPEGGWPRKLEETVDLLDQSIQASRSLAAQLSPPALRQAGLVAALRQLAQKMQQAYHLTVEVTADGEVPDDADGVCTVLYGAVRELLLNTVKHAGVTSASVCVRRAQSGRMEVLVADEGVGFEASRLSADAGFGLWSTRGRIELIGGNMDVQSSPGRGTRVTITAPLGTNAESGGELPAG